MDTVNSATLVTSTAARTMAVTFTKIFIFMELSCSLSSDRRKDGEEQRFTLSAFHL